MKTGLLIIIGMAFSVMMCNAQVVVSVQEPGQLQHELESLNMQGNSLTVKGKLNSTDIAYLRAQLGNNVSLQATYKIEYLDLSETMIVAGGDGYVPVSPISSAIQSDGIVYTEDNVLGFAMFKDCVWLKSIVLPSSIKSISQWCFHADEGLTEIVVPEGVRRIEDHAFSDCTSLETVSLPSTLLSVDAVAFEKCNSLQSVKCHSLIPPAYGFMAFPNRAGIKLQLPERSEEWNNAALERYGNADGWKEFGMVLFYMMETQSVDKTEILTTPVPSTSFDLLGRPIANHSTKGIIIQEGQKYVVK